MALTLRTDEELDNALTALAAAEGLSKQEVIRRAVLDRHARSEHHRLIDAAADEMLEQYGDALDRLGKV